MESNGHPLQRRRPAPDLVLSLWCRMSGKAFSIPHSAQRPPGSAKPECICKRTRHTTLFAGRVEFRRVYLLYCMVGLAWVRFRPDHNVRGFFFDVLQNRHALCRAVRPNRAKPPDSTRPDDFAVASDA